MSVKSEEEDYTQFEENGSMSFDFGKKDEDDTSKSQELFDLLKSWNQLELFEHFTNEQINLEVLAIIKPHHFGRLLEPFNLRAQILFEHNLQLWRESIGSPLPNYPENSSNLGPFRLSRSSSQRSIPYINDSPPIISHQSPSSVQKSTPTTSSESRATLDTILKTSIKGQMLIDIYNQNQKFEEAQRVLLIHLIAEYFNDKSIHLELGATYKLEKDILERFPSEQIEFYRTSKRGRIYNKYCNYKYSLLRVARCTKSKAKSATDSVEAGRTNKKDLVPEEDAEQHIALLKKEKIFSPQFERSWKACMKYRINEIRRSNFSSDVLGKWPQYKLTDGHKYIAMDFNYLQPNSDSLVNDWKSVSAKLLTFLSSGQSVRREEIRSVLSSIKDTISKDCRDAALLWCLHGYLKPTNLISETDAKGKRSINKISIKDSQDSFIYVAKSLQDVESHRRNLTRQYKITNPFIAVLGTDILNFTDIYVCAGDLRYSFDNFINALDICYKIIVLFNLEHPTACKAIWSFIQNCFYESSPNIHFARVHVLINELKEKQ